MGENGKPALFLFLVFSFCFQRPGGALAYFERLTASSRIVSLGGAFVSVSDDPGALLANPAGLAQISGYSFLSTLTRPYGISDLEESFFGAVIPSGLGNLGLSWHRVSLRGVTSEDLITLAFGRDYIRTSQDASLSFGGALNLARVSYSSPYEVSRSRVGLSLGVLLRPFPIIGFGYAVRNLWESSFDFLPGGGETVLSRVHTWGVSYRWNRKVFFLFEREKGQDGIWRNRSGVEVVAYSGLILRSGMRGDDVTGGLGVAISDVNIDVGVSSHDTLGLSYVFSLGFSLSPGEKKR